MTTTLNLYRKIYLAIVAVALLLLVTGTASAQWSPTASPTPTPGTNIYYNSGNVGIGTTSPGAPLDVNAGSGVSLQAAKFTSSGSVATYLKVENTTAPTVQALVLAIPNGGAPFVRFESGTNHPLALGTNDATRLWIDTAGSVGIGTTSPATPLHVSGAGGEMFRITGTSNTNPYLTLVDAGGVTAFFQAAKGANSVLLGSTTNHLVAFYTNGTEKMQISAGGNVGIGTTGPSEKLDVNGFGLFEGGIVTGGIKLQANGGTSSIVLSADNSGATDYVAVGDISNNFTGTQLFAGGGAKVTVLSSNGNVGIGKTNPTVALDVVGSINLTGTVNAKYQDVAEWVLSSERLSAGTVVVLDSTKSNQVISSSVGYDTRVAGVVSERPGLSLGESGEGRVLVATTGRVLVNVDATQGPIHIGDLLVTSNKSGMAMKSEPVNLGGVQLHRPGTLIGKALEPLEKGSGTILMLLSLQ